MSGSDTKFKETLQKKSLPEIEAMLLAIKKMINGEKDLVKLSLLNAELSALLEIRDKKLSASGHHLHKSSTTAKPELKSFDDFIKSKQ